MEDKSKEIPITPSSEKNGEKYRAGYEVEPVFEKIKAFNVVEYIKNSVTDYWNDPQSFMTEILSGITLAIVMVPESVAFSFMAHVEPYAGLSATFWIGLFCGLIGGRPGMISGCAGAMAVVLGDIMKDDGPLGHLDTDTTEKPTREAHLYMCVFLIGIIELACGLIGLSKFVRIIPKSCILGFLNGLGIILVMAQMETYKYCPKSEYYHDCKEDELRWLPLAEGSDGLYGNGNNYTLLFLLLIVFATMAGMYAYPPIEAYFSPNRKLLPPSLIAILVGVFIEWVLLRPFGYSTRTVEETASIAGGFPKFSWPDPGSNPEWGVIISYAFSLAAIGLIETVMTLEVVNEYVGEPPSTFRSNQECLANGVANTMCGLFKGICGSALIGETVLNVMNGAKKRVSSGMSGIGMLFVILFMSRLVEKIPVATLTAIVYVVALNTFYWKSFFLLPIVPKIDAFIIILVTWLAVQTNLAIAIGVGIVVFSIHNVWDQACKMFCRTYFETIVELNHSEGANKSTKIDIPTEKNEEESSKADLKENGGSKIFEHITVNTQGLEGLSGGHAHLDKEITDPIERRRSSDLSHALYAGSKAKVYEVRVNVFFATARNFTNLFSPQEDPAIVICDLTYCHVLDYTGAMALDEVRDKYLEKEKKFFVRGLDDQSFDLVSKILEKEHSMVPIWEDRLSTESEELSQKKDEDPSTKKCVEKFTDHLSSSASTFTVLMKDYGQCICPSLDQEDSTFMQTTPKAQSKASALFNKKKAVHIELTETTSSNKIIVKNDGDKKATPL